jgi:hypothetical protein
MTQIISNKSVAELIDLSESEDRVVLALSSSIDADLHDACDGEVHQTTEVNCRMAEVHEYWGETWCVHTVWYLETVEQANARS